jgi:signal transduction histidine kinase
MQELQGRARIVLVLVLAASYVLAATLGLSFAVVAEQVTVVWPPAGIALAALLLYGRKLWPGILLGAFAANLGAHAPPAVALAIAAGNTVEALVGAWLLERARFHPALARVRDAGALATIPAFVSTPVGATLGAASLCLGGLQPWARYGALWRDWWIGDAVGALVVAPLLLAWLTPAQHHARRSRVEAAALALGTGAFALLSLELPVATGLKPYPVHYLAFPFVLWAALRFGPRATSATVLAIAAIAVAGAIAGLGPFGAQDAGLRLVLLQLWVAVLATTGLLVAALSGERASSAAALGERAHLLETEDRRRTEFLAMLAHELRNPLAPIRHAAQLLETRRSDPEAVRGLGAVIERQVRHLSRLVDDLLDVARMTTGKVRILREPVDLGDVLDAALEVSRPALDAAKIEISVSRPSEPVTVDGDSARLAQVVANLLNNAARYTREGGHVWLTLEPDGASARIRVRDDGVGMTEEVLARAFDLFSQATTTLDRPASGLGVGLTLVRHLVELHGGTVEGRSDGPGRGSEFVVQLPALESTRDASSRTTRESGRPEKRRRSVLVVDDNVDAANTLAALLSLQGHDVRVAFDGEQAIEDAKQSRPDVVVLDIGLPGMNGYEVARTMREDPELSGIRLVALTGYGQADDVERARDAGFDRHFVKPLDPRRLGKLIED